MSDAESVYRRHHRQFWVSDSRQQHSRPTSTGRVRSCLDLLRPRRHVRCWFSKPSNNNNNNNNKKAQLSLTNPRDAKACQNCSNSTCLQRCRWQHWSMFIRLAAVASEICEIPRNSLKIKTYRVQGHPIHRSRCQSNAHPHMQLPISHK